ncbi:hypothetical protein V5O48_019083, partial [Marasmius crinis-equi]
ASNYESAGRKSHVAKVIENLSAVVLYISVFKSGKADIPGDAEELRSHLTELAVDAGQKDEFAQLIAGVKYGRSAARLRGAVYAALAISPLILLTNCELAGNEVKRVDLVQHWMHMGNRYPRVVREIEFMLWACVKRTVDGVMDVRESFKMFTAEAAERLEGSSLGSDDQLFFHQKFGESFDKSKAERVLAAFIEELPESRGTSVSIEGVNTGEREDPGEGSQGLEAGETSKDQGQDAVEGERTNSTLPVTIETPEVKEDIRMGEIDEQASERDGANGISALAEGSEDHSDAVSQEAKLALKTSEETKDTASTADQAPVHDGDVTMGDVNLLEQTGLEESGNGEGVGAPTNCTDATSLPGSDAQREKESQQDGKVIMAEISPFGQVGSVEGGDAEGAARTAEVTEEQLDERPHVISISLTKDTPVATLGDDEDVSMVDPGPPEQTASVQAKGVEDQGQGGHDGENIWAEAGESELQNEGNEISASSGPEATVWIEDVVICVEGDESDSELSESTGSDDDDDSDDTATDSDTDVDHEVAVAAGLKGNTRPTRPRAKAASRTCHESYLFSRVVVSAKWLPSYLEFQGFRYK